MIEKAGVATGVHSWIPELATGTGAPRVVGIGFPGSVPFGLPGDADGQRAVLEASLTALASMSEPGQRVDLPFSWPARTRVPKPPQPPPIARLIMRRPWLFLKLMNGDLPPPPTQEPG